MGRAAARDAVAAALADVKAGESVAEAARRHGAPYGSLYSACRASGIRTRGRAMTPADGTLAALAAMINTDDTLASIAEARGVTRQRIHQLYKKAMAAGIPVRSRARFGGPEEED